ncbi:MAG: hypothetical protein FJ271_27590 [Planctomycetes bacterium]|nr:hypothetical protein [Planctomycetota bacterium]
MPSLAEIDLDDILTSAPSPYLASTRVEELVDFIDVWDCSNSELCFSTVFAFTLSILESPGDAMFFACPVVWVRPTG